jgi:hypothetical protein
MTTYHGRQIQYVDPDENRIPQDIRIKMSSDCGVTKWFNINYDAFEAIAIAILENEDSHDVTLVPGCVKTTPAINNNNSG